MAPCQTHQSIVVQAFFAILLLVLPPSRQMLPEFEQSLRATQKQTMFECIYGMD